MSFSYNKVMIVGNLGSDPEIRSVANGKEVASFSIATSENWKDKNTGEYKPITDWHNVVIWNEHFIGLIKRHNVKKGSKLLVEGSLKYSKWQDKNGVERTKAEVVIQAFSGSIVIMDKQSAGSEEQVLHQRNNNTPEIILEDEIPF